MNLNFLRTGKVGGGSTQRIVTQRPPLTFAATALVLPLRYRYTLLFILFSVPPKYFHSLVTVEIFLFDLLLLLLLRF